MDANKSILIAKHLPLEFKTKAIQLLREYMDVFAWSYTDLRGVPPSLCTHKIEILPNMEPKRQAAYRMNPNYQELVKEELDKVFRARFIYPIKNAIWLLFQRKMESYASVLITKS